MKYVVQDIETGEVETWTLAQLLQEVNRDRSEEWTDYDETDWREGWNEWCEGDCYTLVTTIAEDEDED